MQKLTMLLNQTSQSDHENSCRMDVFGLADVSENDRSMVHAEFKERLVRADERLGLTYVLRSSVKSEYSHMMMKYVRDSLT